MANVPILADGLLMRIVVKFKCIFPSNIFLDLHMFSDTDRICIIFCFKLFCFAFCFSVFGPIKRAAGLDFVKFEIYDKNALVVIVLIHIKFAGSIAK